MNTYYGWPYYWSEDVIFGFGGSAPAAEEIQVAEDVRAERHLRDDPHLQSTLGVTGYGIETSDGTIGHVRDFMVDEKTWVIQHLLVETGHWYSGKEVLISTEKIARFDNTESKVHVNLTKEEIEQTSDHDLVRALSWNKAPPTARPSAAPPLGRVSPHSQSDDPLRSWG